MRYPYLMVMKRPGDKYPTEYPCVSMNDLETTYNIFVDSDEYEVEFYDATHQIFPDFWKDDNDESEDRKQAGRPVAAALP